MSYWLEFLGWWISVAIVACALWYLVRRGGE